MKSRGILFRPELVRAILEGRKTVTRRVVKPGGNGECPYGIPGDQLYVKEALRWDDAAGRAVFPDGEPSLVTRWGWARPYLSPIHMPRGAARLWLLIKVANAEKLIDIDDAEARAEGCDSRDHFLDLWDEINAKRGHAAVSSPWVWRIEFARLP